MKTFLSGTRTIALEQFLGDLHGVERRALAHVVGHDPEVQAVFNAFVLADAPHKGGIVADAVGGHGVHEFARIVENLHARSLGEHDPGFLGRDLLFGFDIHGFRMAEKYRHARAGSRDLD